MKTLVDQLSQYAAYHRDRRNIFTHFIGIPMIVVAITVLLARVSFEASGITWSLAALASLVAVLYYLRLDVRYGVTMGVLLSASVWWSQQVAALNQTTWLAIGIGLFVLGWVFQFIGHYFEGRKPAFVDDLIGLIIGPLFVVAELGFLLGLRREVAQAIEARFKS